MFDRVLNASFIFSVLNVPFILRPYMRIRIPAWEFECPHSLLFQKLGVLNLFQTTISLIMKASQLTVNQIDWFLYERDCCLEWVKKWVQLLRNTWWNFFFLVKLLKYLKISPNIVCSNSIITTLEEGVKICSKLTIKTPDRRQWRRSVVINVKFQHTLLFLLVFLL